MSLKILFTVMPLLLGNRVDIYRFQWAFMEYLREWDPSTEKASKILPVFSVF